MGRGARTHPSFFFPSELLLCDECLLLILSLALLSPLNGRMIWLFASLTPSRVGKPERGEERNNPLVLAQAGTDTQKVKFVFRNLVYFNV